jgi:hypothetical protein
VPHYSFVSLISADVAMDPYMEFLEKTLVATNRWCGASIKE